MKKAYIQTGHFQFSLPAAEAGKNEKIPAALCFDTQLAARLHNDRPARREENTPPKAASLQQKNLPKQLVHEKLCGSTATHLKTAYAVAAYLRMDDYPEIFTYKIIIHKALFRKAKSAGQCNFVDYAKILCNHFYVNFRNA